MSDRILVMREGRLVAVVAPEDVDRALAVLTARHVPAWVLGDVVRSDEPGAALAGEHPRF